jgi:HEAT repeat protein/beta-lactamase regulating signal transducer with metallopeptidase domain
MSYLNAWLSGIHAETLGWTLLHFIWQGTLVTALAAGLQRALAPRSAKLRYTVACGVLLLMLGLPALTVWWMSGGTTSEAARGTPMADAIYLAPAHATPAVAPTAPPSPGPSPLPSAAHVRATVAPAAVPAWLAYAGALCRGALPYLALLWIAGVIALSIQLAGGWIVAQRLRGNGGEPLLGDRAVLAERLTRRLGIERVQFRETDRLEVPMVIGWLRPVVLVPTSTLSGLTPTQLESVLAHELAHIRRRDYLVNLLQSTVETLLFFHPAIWRVSEQIRVERENCCDDLAVAVCGDAYLYACALTRIEELRASSSRLTLAIGGGSISARVRRLLALPSPAKPSGRGLIGGLILALASGVSAGMPLLPDSPSPMINLAAGPHSAEERSMKSTRLDPAGEKAADSKEKDDKDKDKGKKDSYSSSNAPVEPRRQIQIMIQARIGSTDWTKGLTSDELASELQSRNPQTRREILWALGHHGDDRTTALVVPLLKDDDWEVRHLAVYALRTAGAKAVGPLSEALRDESWKVRQLAASELGDLGDSRAVEPLIGALQDESWEVRHLAASSLGLLADRRAVRPLIGALSDPSWKVRHLAAWSLGRLGDREAVDPLLKALGDESPNVRHTAAWALGDLRDPRALGPLTNALRDSDPLAREGAAAGLGEIGGARVVQPLIAALRDPAPRVRRVAAWALGRAGEASAVPALRAAQSDSDAKVQAEAKAALSRLSTPGR